MPGTNLTRDEALTRAALLSADSYDVDLDLTTGDKTFASTTTLRFSCRTPGISTFADLVGAENLRVTLNGRELDADAVYSEGRIALEDLEGENELVVACDLPYSHTGEGLHRFVDPADDRVYLYTQFEVPDARRVYCTFEQPDLKSVFTFTVTAPEGWAVVSNSPTPEPESLGGDRARWSFAPTQRMSTYITALVAGEYHAVHDVYEGAHGTIPLGHYCRQSVKAFLDIDDLLEVTKQGFAFFEEAFGFPYPFGKYDQLYVPEYNMGAMENAGCVTFRDEYLPRSRQVRAFYEQRANTVLHEMAHMWFGDLVTMKWWDDLWLNESFAEWASHHASVEATQYDEAWTGFTNARKNWAYRQDQLPSTHPIAADNYDLEQVEVNFDGITYAKGASTLKQLVAWVGLPEFLAGLRAYFEAHAFGNSEFADLLSALEESSGRELDEWAAAWLQTSGVNTLRAEFEVDADGTYSAFAVRQSAHPDFPTLRPHRLGIGLYDREGDRLVRRESLEVDVTGESTDLAELVGVRQPDLLLLNDRDLTYAKIRLDERSLATVVESLSTLDDSLARALCWGAAWDMTRDAELPATDFVELVLRGLPTETDQMAVLRLPAQGSQAVHSYSDPAHRTELRRRWESGLHELVQGAEAGSDHQLSFTRALAGAAHGEEVLDLLQGLLDGTRTLDGLSVDTDLRWTLLTGLARAGRVDEDRIAAELRRDDTISGRERAAAASAARPDADAKEAAWRRAVVETGTANETARAIVTTFMQPGQTDVLEPYAAAYLEAADGLIEHLGFHRASVALEALFPRPLAAPDLLTRVDAWLEESQASSAAKRYVREGRDDVARALRAQECDAAR